MTCICSICKQDKEYWQNTDPYDHLSIYRPDASWVCKDCYEEREQRIEQDKIKYWEELEKECPLPLFEDGIEWGCDKMYGNKDIDKLRKHITQKHTKAQMVDFIIDNIRLWNP